MLRRYDTFLTKIVPQLQLGLPTSLGNREDLSAPPPIQLIKTRHNIFVTMFATAARHLARTPASRTAASTSIRAFASLEQFDEFGKHVFTGKVADTYLAKHGGSGDMLKDPTWVNNHADVVANAVFDW